MLYPLSYGRGSHILPGAGYRAYNYPSHRGMLMAYKEQRTSGSATPDDAPNQQRLLSEIAELKQQINKLEQENKALRQRILELGRQDQLTGLFNRRTMLERLKEEFFRAGRYHYHLSVLVVDLDHFKHVNDQFGQERGDEVIRIVANVLTDTAREGDTVARIGDQLLSVVLPYSSKKDSQAFGERLRKRIRGLYTHPGHTGQIPCELTASVGCASTEAGIGDEELLLQKAEDMMLEAKQNGGNQVRVYELDDLE